MYILTHCSACVFNTETTHTQKTCQAPLSTKLLCVMSSSNKKLKYETKCEKLKGKMKNKHGYERSDASDYDETPGNAFKKTQSKLI